MRIMAFLRLLIYGFTKLAQHTSIDLLQLDQLLDLAQFGGNSLQPTRNVRLRFCPGIVQ